MAAGFNPDAFWRITPREMQAHLDGATERVKREHDERAWLAWHTAALYRMKKMPPMKDMLSGAKPKRRKTWQEQLEAVMAFDKRINARDAG